MKKNILITGATSGIGYATAEGLVKKGHNVIINGRDHKKAKIALKKLKEISNGAEVDYILSDLSTKKGVYQLIEQVNQKLDHLDILINNAGLLSGERKLTEDGFEAHLAVNHIMPALLATELKPLLQKSEDARIIFLTTGGHHFSKINFDDLQYQERFYAFEAYGSSKLMHLMWNYAIAEEWKSDGIKLFASDPGGANTSMTQQMKASYLPFPWKLLFPLMKLTVGGSAQKAAEPSIYLSISDTIKDKTALYFNHKLKKVKSSKLSYDSNTQERVKEVTKIWVEKLKK